MKKLILAVALSCVVALPALAQQLAPTPRSAPRTPVGRESLIERRAAPPRDVEGKALILDGEKLRIGEVDLRLFGIVPPQLSANFGPQARAALDSIIGGGQNIQCHMRDRDHDGRLLATCRAANGEDPALVLLRRGLAVVARGSIAETELAEPYITAEQQALNEKIGLWSTAAPVPSSAVPAPVIIEGAKPETQKTEAAKLDAASAKSTDVQPKTNSAVFVPVKQAASNEEPKTAVEETSVFARYQILIAGSLMLLTALSILGSLAIYRRREKRDEMKALAAALRGELQAARAVCLTRVSSIITEDDDRASTWPRIRSTLYQAYVGKLGWLGAELARQVASIYGQASDYASYYYNLGENNASAMPKRQALQALAGHIEAVLPRLASIEQSGRRTLTQSHSATMSMPPVPDRPAMPKPVTKMITHAASVSVPVAPVPTAATPQGESRLLSALRHLRERFIETPGSAAVVEEPIGDYAAIIEEEAERYGYGAEVVEESTAGKRGSQ